MKYLDLLLEPRQSSQMTIQIPIFCEQCNAVYPSGIALGEGAKLGINSISFGCPRGHASQIPDGVFEVRDGLMRINTAQGSEPVLDRIHRLATDAVKGKTDADEAIKAIEALAPSLAPILKLVGNRGSLVGIALILWFVVEMTKAFNPNGISTPIHIDNRPTIINQITIDKGISANPELSPTNRGIADDKSKKSKRKARRLRGKARHN